MLSHLFVTQDFGPDRGGMARRHVELCRRFAPERLAVSTVGSDGAEAFDRGEPYAIVRQPFPFRTANRFANQLRWADWLARRLRGVGGEDVMHCGNVRPVGYAVWWAHRRTHTPFLLYVNGGDLLRERRKVASSAMKRRSARAIFAAAAGVVANSAWTARLAEAVMRETGTETPPPVAGIDLGTDPDWFRPERDAGLLRRRFGLGDAPVMLTVARLVRHKGQDAALRALSLLAGEFPALRYVLVGEGDDEPRLRELAAELGVRDQVVFAGTLGDDEIADAYATATLYVGPSRVDNEINAEGFGISFVEAGASGVPSVAGDSGGVRSAVRDGETGLVVPPTDAEAIAAAIASVLREPARGAAMGRAARVAVETHYNWDRVARETLAFTHRCVAERRADAPRPTPTAPPAPARAR